MPLHDGQRTYLKNSTKKTNLLISGNRWGKSTVIAIKHIHKNFYKIGRHPGNGDAWAKAEYRTANIAPHSKLVEPVFRTIRNILESSFAIPQEDGTLRTNECQIGWFLKDFRESMPMVLRYTNGAYTEFLSTGEDKGDSLQGRPFGYISYDEGGRSDHLGYELEANIMGRLGDWNGQLDIPSTPDQKSPSILHHWQLFRKGQNGDPDVYSQSGSAAENTFLPPNYVPDTIRRLEGDPILRQVVYGEFVFAGDSIFPSDEIDDAKDATLNHGERWQEGHSYIIGIDTALGDDECVYMVIDCTEMPLRLVRIMGAKGSAKSPEIHINDLIDLFDSYNREGKVKIMLETYDAASKRFYLDMPPYMQRVTTCYGSWQPDGVKVNGRNPKAVRKAELIQALRKALSKKILRLPMENTLLEQLTIYREDDTRITQDRVIALALATYLATDGRPKNPNVQFVSVSW